ncbi:MULTISPECIES: hypothetical protein [Nocardia]|uniref:hypothetical protein n=1 Tax=Nocardia TaxID=1817 RepID=UPI00189515DC|nr:MULTISPECIES: hypothetical protein [Nocardia]MBF6347728.1 hypothetical protein [Nocardia flavorosea]
MTDTGTRVRWITTVQLAIPFAGPVVTRRVARPPLVYGFDRVLRTVAHDLTGAADG